MLASRLIIAPKLGAFLIASSILAGGCASTPIADPPAAGLIQTIYSDDGASELSTPETWTARPDFGPDAGIRVAKQTGEAYLLVNSYFPGDVDPVTVTEFADNYADDLATKLPNATVSQSGPLTINGMEAYRHIITGDVADERLTCVTTVIRGNRAMHHVIGWVAADSYSGEQHILNRITGSFRESNNLRPSRQRVTLNFRWPKQLQSVSAFHQKSVKHGKESEIKAHYLSTVRPGDDDELIVSTRVMRQDVINADAEKIDYLSTLLEQVTTEIPDYVISGGGEFVRVDDLAAYQQRIETAVVSSLPANVKSRKDEILATVRKKLSEQVLGATVAGEWNKTVGNWVGSSYAMGETYRFKEAYYSPRLGEAPFTMNVSRQLAGFAPCSDNASTCVKLIHIATVSGEDFRSAMARHIEKVVGQHVDVTRVSFVRKKEIIAEPDTLIPHRSRSTEETIVIVEDDSGEQHTSRDTEHTRVVYSYETQTAFK